jgi:hypothetical protein
MLADTYPSTARQLHLLTYFAISPVREMQSYLDLGDWQSCPLLFLGVNGVSLVKRD